MHPIERLRYVARSGQADPRMMVQETAAALRGLHLDPGGLVLACRRIVERHPTCGPLWWLSAHLMVAADPFDATRDLAEHIVEDPTPERLADALPPDATVCVLGWPDVVAEALARRGDVRSLVIDVGGEGEQLVRRLQRHDLDTDVVEPEAIAAAVLASDVVLLEPSVAGANDMLACTGSHAAAAVAYAAGLPTWVVLPRGRCLPPMLWAGLLERWELTGPTWSRSVERTPWNLVTHTFSERGLATMDQADRRPCCPDTPELLRSSAI